MKCLTNQLILSHYSPENSKMTVTRAVTRSPFNLNRNKLLLSSYKYNKSSFICRTEKLCMIKGRSASDRRVSSLGPIRASSHSFDVVVVGAGIIGMTIARQLLLHSDLSVALVDAKVPCSGATGAGQGYIWMVHKSPENTKWDLAMRSRQLWENLAEEVQNQGMDPFETFGWKKTGSLLIGRTTEESDMLKKRVHQLSKAGLRAEFLSSQDLMIEEPAVRVGEEGGAAFLPDDYQMDAKRSVSYLEKSIQIMEKCNIGLLIANIINRSFSSEGRYAEFYHEPATGLLRSGNGEVVAVETHNNVVHGKKAVVIAAGCWSGSLMQDLIRDSDIEMDVPVKPRKGHLLVLENFNSFKLNHGLMEAGYVDHQSATLNSTNSGSTPVNAHTTSVSMAATMDGLGNLVLGSSRQLVGFNTEIDETVINRIWDRAAEFLPALKGSSLNSFCKSREVRVGLRAYMPDGKPVIGPVPNMPNLFLAAGHEGEGLALALGTAEMVADMVLGSPGKVDNSPYAVQSRCG